MLQKLEVIVVFHANGSRKSPGGRRLGRGDSVHLWKKPPRPEWMEDVLYRQMPDQLEVRECEVVVSVRGFRSRTITIVTTLIHPKEAARQELGDLYLRRWMAEVYFYSIKQVLNMNFLRSKTPEAVRRELLVTLLAYNLIRKIIVDAAVQHGVKPYEISFKATLQTFNEYRHLWKIPHLNPKELYKYILLNIIQTRVGHRPGRIEPRAVKRRPKSFPRLQLPRTQARAKIVHSQSHHLSLDAVTHAVASLFNFRLTKKARCNIF